MDVRSYAYDNEVMEQKVKAKEMEIEEIIGLAKICILITAGIGAVAGSLITWLLLL